MASSTHITYSVWGDLLASVTFRRKLLTIDVGDQLVEQTPIDDVLKSFIGDRGVATKLAHDRIPFNTDPFDPENRVILSAGPLQTSDMSCTGRMNATTLSPLTNGLTSTNAGGFLSRNLVATGYPCVEIVGQSDELLAIHVTDNEVQFETVPELGKATVKETSAVMNERHALNGEHLVTIGPAGENQVRYAALMTSDSRAFGRGGVGAVFGSKNIKTVSFDGDTSLTIKLLNEEVAEEIYRDAATTDHIMKR